jgi:hypothetical protein
MNLIRTLCLGGLLSGLALSGSPVLAQDPQPDHPLLDFCKSNPAKCQEIEAQAKAKCDADPAACEARKQQFQQKLADIKAKCDADPQACAARKAEFQQKREAMKAKCDADPAACEAMKQKFLEKRSERNDAAIPATPAP